MKICIPKEIYENEKRVAGTPETIAKIKALGFAVAVEKDAGLEASFTDEAFSAAGAEIISEASQLWSTGDVILKVRAPLRREIESMKSGQILISFIWPGQNPELLAALAEKKVTVLAMDCVPRISRAQKLDALSSMANIAGYRAVIEAAHHFGRFFTGQITAAGKIPPAQVFVIGAGVAGLSAIGTAASLGAIVRANDTRPEVADQVSSMGGQFVAIPIATENSATAGGYAKTMSPEFLAAQRTVFEAQTEKADIVITTALIPGKPAPVLISEAMVKSMKQGSVIVDMAAEQGGNCALTEPGFVVQKFGVTIIGYMDLPSRLARQSSTLYGTNLFRLLEELSPNKNGVVEYSMGDEVLGSATVINQGQLTWPTLIKSAVSVAAPNNKLASAAPRIDKEKVKAKDRSWIIIVLGAVAMILAGTLGSSVLVSQITVFTLSCFIGYQVVWNVSAALHTPLMSVTNAISSIVVVGAVLQVSSDQILIQVLSCAAILLTSVNMFGGFAVTGRMLSMFKK